mgnify:CR=1 FL=1
MKFEVTSSPHIRGKRNTQNIMLDVILALIPTLLVGVVRFGMNALVVTLVSVVAAVAAEWICGMIVYRKNTVKDLSSVVTGLLLALTLPATVPYWAVTLGSAFAIIVVKGLCGGLGKNIFNPALGARAFLMLVCPVYLVRYVAPGAVDGVTSATPLHHMVMPALPEESIADMFLGNIGGCIGEVCTAALLAGGIYLIWKRVISVRIPAAYLGTVAVLTLVFAKGDNAFAWMLYSLLGGGVVLGAFFMATDYATSPVTPKGQIIYGIGCGIFTVIFRYFGLFPEGVTYAILLMNACAWAIDRYMAPRRFGTKKGGAA